MSKQIEIDYKQLYIDKCNEFDIQNNELLCAKSKIEKLVYNNKYIKHKI